MNANEKGTWFCPCDKWERGVEKLIAQAVFCANQLAGPKWTKDDPKFVYCPYCGEQLSINKESSAHIEFVAEE